MYNLRIVSRRFGVNPDNIATPVAAALGDLVTLGLLAVVGTVLRSSGFVPPVLILILYVVVANYCRRLGLRTKDPNRPNHPNYPN